MTAHPVIPRAACATVFLATLALFAPVQAESTDLLSMYPPTKEDPVTDSYGAVQVQDPYRWLEDATDPKVQDWIAAQGQLTRDYLDKLPGRDALKAQYDDLWSYPLSFSPEMHGEQLFWSHREPNQNQPVVMTGRFGANLNHGHPFIDPNTLSTDGTVALDWMRPSRDGQLVAYGTSSGGTELSTLHLRPTGGGPDLPDQIPDTRAASIAWLPDASGFYYSKLPAKGTVPDDELQFHRHIFFHRIGTAPESDPLVYGADEPKETWIDCATASDFSKLFISTSIDWAKNDLYMRPLSGNAHAPLTIIAKGLDGQTAADVLGETLIVQTNVDHPRFHILTAPLSHLTERTEIIPEGEGVIQSFTIVGGKLVLLTLENAYHHLKIYDITGKLLREIALPTLGSIDSLSGNPDTPDFIFSFNSFAYPPTIFRCNVDTGALTTVDRMNIPIDWDRYEARQEWATSKDGTKIPMFIVMKKGLQLDGSNPTMLTGYGGFDVSLTPAFGRGQLPWLEAGGILVTANLRGGGEFGAKWHEDGRLEKKQNVFDDFIACSEYLIQQGYTSTPKLAISGGSNGGLLMGAMLTQRPDLFKAVICAVPLLDMLRYQKFLLGKLWVPEYGDPDKPEDFKWLYAYSPYHHVAQGVAYPATLFMSGDQDSRVDPLHARKMAAEMQAKSSGAGPILLRVELKAGHGQGTPLSKQIDELVDQYTFIASQLGMTNFPAASALLPSADGGK